MTFLATTPSYIIILCILFLISAVFLSWKIYSADNTEYTAVPRPKSKPADQKNITLKKNARRVMADIQRGQFKSSE